MAIGMIRQLKRWQVGLCVLVAILAVTLGNWKNDRVFQLLNDARKENDPAKRVSLYAEVDRILFEEAVRIPIVHSEPLLAQRTTVSGWKSSLFGPESFEAMQKQ
jgi:peptide/nickel transport system substrate-binding protein